LPPISEIPSRSFFCFELISCEVVLTNWRVSQFQILKQTLI
jgi:hypothetical protein